MKNRRFKVRAKTHPFRLLNAGEDIATQYPFSTIGLSAEFLIVSPAVFSVERPVEL